MTTKYTLMTVFLFASSLMLSACNREKEQEEEAPQIMLKSGGDYTSTDATLGVGEEVTVGIVASVREKNDPLVRFNISESIDEADPTDVYTESISAETYEYDFQFTTSEDMIGHSVRYIFTITNRDGLIGQQSLTFEVE